MVTVGKTVDELLSKLMATNYQLNPEVQGGSPVNLPNPREHSLLEKSIPGRHGQRNSINR